MKPEIVVEIDQKGESVRLEVKGESGRRCLETTTSLVEALGEVVNRTYKADYYVQRARGKNRSKTDVRCDA